MAKQEMIWATGRRKCASASVRITSGSGKVTVNGEDGLAYFNTDALMGYVTQPLRLLGKAGEFDVVATVKGGGLMGQAGAVRHGVARALTKIDETLRPALKKAGMLTRDSRVKERKKSGQPGARKRFQFAKR